ncbi:MAG: hypothetical protein JSR59_00905 [Proteobacteria bacterium]|nr:hypothetical protein [Pseudomonadota bacterium]
MWDSALQSSTQLVTHALLHKTVPPADALAFEKVSGAVAVRAALRLLAGEQSLLFAVPEATASTARHIVASLLIGDHAHANAQGQVPQVDERHLLRGDIVLVTQAVSAGKARLENLPIGRGQHLADLWEVTTLSRYTAAKSSKPRVFLANPGWLEKTMSGRRFGAVVIDASHPSTFAQLPQLMRAASGCTRLRIAVSPPPGEDVLAACGHPSKLQVWMWDSQAKCDAETAVEAHDPKPRASGDRHLWVCDSDAEVTQVLAEVYKWLTSAARAAEGRAYPGLRQCWRLYNRLRQVAVPLAQLEQVAATTWAGNLRQRIAELDSVSGHGSVAWDTTWPQLVAALKAAYETLLRRKETAKFWGIATNLQAFLPSATPHLRIVVGSEAEVTLLAPALELVVDGFPNALASGRVEFVTGSKEAKLVAEGDVCPTVLLAPRTNGHRYLDVFPSARVDELLYPHEVAAEQGNQMRLHRAWAPRVDDEARVRFLAPFGFKPLSSSVPCPPARPPAVVVRSSSGHAVALVTQAEVTGEIDIDALAGASGGDLFDGHEPTEYLSTSGAGAVTEVCFTNGERRQFYGGQKLDIFLSETSNIQRHAAQAVRPGWQVITFVDGRYDGLFQRLADVVNSRLPPTERVALELWRQAKEHLAARFDNKSELYSRLASKGLTSGYAALISWLSGGDDAIAPQQFSEFKVLASEMETYANSKVMLDSAFKAVQHERGRNRKLGRTLRAFLRAAITGDGYEDALAGARTIDAGVADVFAAVEVLEVQSVREVTRSS